MTRCELKRFVDSTSVNDLSALHADEFRAWFQPIVDLQSGERLATKRSRVGCIRTRSSKPKEFIVVAEETGLIRSIGSAVIVEALAHVGRLPSGQVLTINASPDTAFGPRVC